MTSRILLAALLAGLAMFLWEFVAHEVLPIGEAGVMALPNEAPVQAAIKEHVRESGFYVVPAPSHATGMTAEQKEQADAKMMEAWATGPAGVMILHPHGKPISMPRLFAAQFGADFLAMLVAAMLLAQAAVLDYGRRVVFVAMLGVIPTLAVGIPQWNWYGFPSLYVVGQFVTHVVGFTLGGLILGKVLPRAK